MDLKIIELYKQIHQRLFPEQSFSVPNETLIDNFVKLLEKETTGSAGCNYVYDYIVFQHEYWLDKEELRFGKRKFPSSWIFGPKAFERWKSKPKDCMYHVHTKMERLGINRGIIHKIEKTKVDVLSLNESEEFEKKRWYNQELGFTNCIESTTLFNDRSDLCTNCIHQKVCKSLLKANYLNIYLLRGYEF